MRSASSFLVFLPLFRAQDIPFLHFAYPGYEEPLYFQEYEDLLGADYMKRLVSGAMIPHVMEACVEDCLKGLSLGQSNLQPEGAGTNNRVQL